jgi:nucleotide-binding universal stress UspA family protein
VGSKGLKPRSCDLSSRIRQFVYESKFHLGIVKQAGRELGRVLFLLDGSETSLDGLSSALDFCKRFSKELMVLHTFNQDLRKHCRHIKLLLRGVQEERKDMKWEQVFEERPLLQAVQERAGSFDWVILNKNGFRGSINKQRFVGSNTSAILEQVDCNLIIFA